MDNVRDKIGRNALNLKLIVGQSLVRQVGANIRVASHKGTAIELAFSIRSVRHPIRRTLYESYITNDDI
jgi:hypothetical protein